MSLSFFLYSIVLKVSLAQLIAAMCCAKDTLSTIEYKKKLKDISSRSFEFLHYLLHMLGLQIRMDGEEGFSVFIAAVSSTSNVQFLLYGRLC